jgi:hypothetical protein
MLDTVRIGKNLFDLTVREGRKSSWLTLDAYTDLENMNNSWFVVILEKSGKTQGILIYLREFAEQSVSPS